MDNLRRTLVTDHIFSGLFITFIKKVFIKAIIKKSIVKKFDLFSFRFLIKDLKQPYNLINNHITILHMFVLSDNINIQT